MCNSLLGRQKRAIVKIAATVSQANDKQQAVPMACAVLNNIDAAKIERPQSADGTPVLIPNTADTGYFSEQAVAELEKKGIDPYFATGRRKHHEAAALLAEGESPVASAKEQMQHKLRTATGKRLYAARKYIVEPVFGQIKAVRGIRKFLLRGLAKVAAEWQLICLTHNVLKIWRRVSAATAR
jgi:hypothetical protein